jgi:hypothetical protein
MDPISAMATATAAFSALKKGFAVGRDIEAMASDLSRWMGALSDLDQMEREAKNPPLFKKLFGGQSVEQEAITAFANKQKAQQQRYELQQWISLTMGKSKWDELVKMEGQIRKRRKETLYRQRERRRKFVEVVAWIIVAGAGMTVLTAFVMLLKAHTANAADPEFVACRLVGCTVVDKDRICVYRGANHTQDVLYYRLDEWFPREFQCKYAPNEKPPPTVQEVLKAIKDKMS